MDIFDFTDDILHTTKPHSVDNILKLANHFGIGNDYEIQIHGANTDRLYIDFRKDKITISILYKTYNGRTYDLIESSITKYR